MFLKVTALNEHALIILFSMIFLLQGSPQLQTKLGLLMFMIGWLANCPSVVSAFLENPSNVSYLTSQVSTHDSDESELLAQGKQDLQVIN